MQSGDIPVPANPGPPGKWPLKRRERERERELTADVTSQMAPRAFCDDHPFTGRAVQIADVPSLELATHHPVAHSGSAVAAFTSQKQGRGGGLGPLAGVDCQAPEIAKQLEDDLHCGT